MPQESSIQRASCIARTLPCGLPASCGALRPSPVLTIGARCRPALRIAFTPAIRACCRLHIADAFVPEENLLGGRTGTYPVILDSLSENRVGVSANALGIARAALDAALAFARDRQVGRSRVADFQAIRHKLADMAAATIRCKTVGTPSCGPSSGGAPASSQRL